MNQRATILALFILATAPQVVAAQDTQLPSDVDLRAAYCAKLLQNTIASLQSGINSAANSTDPKVQGLTSSLQKNLDYQRDSLKRIQAYLLPRSLYLEPTGLMLAMRRGEADSIQMQQGDFINSCASQCGIASATGDAREKAIACTTTCINDDPLVTRASRCRQLDWLPF